MNDSRRSVMTMAAGRTASTATLAWRSGWCWLVPLLSLAAALLLGWMGWNTPLFHLLNMVYRIGPDGFWSRVTIFGDALVALVLLAPFVGRRPDILWSALIAAVLAALWVHGLKEFLLIPRPAAVLAPGELYSIGSIHRQGAFPSGHAATAFTLVGVVAIRLRRPSWTVLLLPLAALVALSRIMVGAHWPIDLLGGAFGGWLAAVLGTMLAGRLAWGLRRWVQAGIGLALLGGGLWLWVFDTGYPAAVGLQRLLGVLGAGFATYGLWKLLGGQGPPPARHE